MARYITTTLPYVNAQPHIGHALEFVQADALARVWSIAGEDVFFNTGVDEHGQKILEAAKAAGQEVQAYVDHFANEFKKLDTALGLGEHTFIRTTDPKHVVAAQEMWRRCAQKGDIYKKAYEGLYCVGHEAFVTEKDLVDGKCPDHGTEPEHLKEENYFFKLSAYKDALREQLTNESSVVPDFRRKEILNFIEDLEDISISREAKRLPWGIPVPDDDAQVMYVWFDALTNYISTLGWPDDAEGTFKKFWQDGTVVQVAGKDQMRFQSVIWQAMLKSADLKATDTIFYHGFINSGGKKMSKSLGNVINPYELVKKYGTDATRYLLLRHVHPTDDSDVTWEKLDEWYTANLVNGLGNLVARVMKLAETHLLEPIAQPEPSAFPEEYRKLIDVFEFQQVMDLIWRRITALDERITNEEPFKLVKEDNEKGKKLIAELVLELYDLGRLLNPVMPEANVTIQKAVLENKKPENLFPRLS